MRSHRTSFWIQVASPSAILGLVLLATQACSTPESINVWTSFLNECDSSAFGDPGSAELDNIERCTRLWFAYHWNGPAGGDYGDRVKEGLRRLYVEGTNDQAHLARQVLNRLEVSSLPKRTGRAPTKDIVQKVQVEREKCDVPPPSKSDKRAANKAFKRGIAAYKVENYESALGHYLRMIDIAPGWTKSHYNVAAMYAMTDGEEEMIHHLLCLRDIGTSDAIKALYRARKDEDFAGIRDDSPGFKVVTGYARVKIGNSLGEYGEDNVDNLEGTLEALGYPAPAITETGKPYTEPHIWYRMETRLSAFMILKLLDHPRTRTHIIDWEGEDYDIIIAWGDSIKNGAEPKMYVSDPADSEKAIADYRRRHEEAMRKPEKFTRAVDDTLGKPEAAVNSASSTLDRTLNTGKKLKNSADKILNFGL